MDPYKSEEEQVEAIKKWWQENGKSIIAGIAMGLIAIFGWRGYTQHQVTQAQQASTLYEQMIFAARADDEENSRVYADRIIDEHDNTTYALFAKMMLAKLAVQNEQLDTAIEQLQWVLDNNKQPEIEHVARLRLARVYIADDQLAAAEKLLGISNEGKFVAQYEELRGDVLAKQGNTEAARDAYQKALLNTIATDEAQSVLEMKIDNLGQG